MGEKGANAQDSPDISMKMNGINGVGVCGEVDDEPIDSQDDSQASSEVSSTKKSMDDATAAAAVTVTAMVQKSITSSEATSNKGNGNHDEDDDDDEDEEEEEEDDNEDDEDEDDDGGGGGGVGGDDIEEATPAAVASSTATTIEADVNTTTTNTDSTVDTRRENDDDTVDSMKPTLATVPEDSQEADDADDDEEDDEEVASSHSSEQIGNQVPANENGAAVESKTDEDDTQDSEAPAPHPVEEVDDDEEDVTQDSTTPSDEKNPLHDGEITETTVTTPTATTITAATTIAATTIAATITAATITAATTTTTTTTTITTAVTNDGDENDDGDEPMVIDDAVNGDSNGAASSVGDNDVQHVPIVQEVHAISDSDDEDVVNTGNKNAQNVRPVEHMVVDGPAKTLTSPSVASANQPNGHNNKPAITVDAKNVARVNDDDDKPVSIASDSDTEIEIRPSQQTPKKNGSSAVTIISKVLSDNEDCVVIEDDNSKKGDDDLLSPRRSARSRKSVVKVRDFSAFDDDIEEVVEDPLSQQPAAKKPKISGTSPTTLGFTIQDARSLAADPLSTNASFQQQFIQSSHDASVVGTPTSRKKEPTLVIIDTNQIMARGGAAATVQALQNQNFSVHPVGPSMSAAGGMPAQTGGMGAYATNTNMRASITPILQQKSPQTTGITTTMVKSPMVGAGAATPTVAAPPLLPALTDDMFVLEAPSFIVPYIYEKPPSDNLKDIVDKIGKELAEQRAKDDLEDAANEAKELEAMSDEQKAIAAAEQLKKGDDNKKKKNAKKQAAKSGDESWDESDTSTDDEASDTEQQRTKVLIKAVDEDHLDSIKTHIITPDSGIGKDPLANIAMAAAKRDNYFESPLGKFFMDIGINLVQEHVQTDLLRQQKRKLVREGEAAAASVQMAINSLKKNLEHSKVKNEIFKFETKRCEYCNFKSESALSMANHYEAPHQVGPMYKCNFCSFESRPPYDILFHMEAIHNVKARLEKTISYHQCPNCPFEDNGKSKLARHTLVCVKKFRPEVNLSPPLDWEPPAKIPRIKPRHGLVGTATAYQAMAAQAQRAASGAALQQRQNAANVAMMRGRGRPQTITKTSPVGVTVLRANHHTPPARPPPMPANMNIPTNFQLSSAGQFIQVTGAGLALLPNARNSTYITQVQSPGPKSSKSQQPSISITPLPRQPNNNTAAMQAAAAGASSKSPNVAGIKPGQSPTTAAGGGKASFVICEICDGYIKDLDQLRNHMQWMHKVKIHPKMIYNRPPLNCQKCQFRFFTDQGLERHLLGSHGLVTSSMQEAANKGKDAGRCPVCGRMYQWKLLNHVSRDHNMTLKPAHLSYKCTVCTATFGMYKQFENHVYSAHSTVAKKAMDGKSKPTAGSSKGSTGASNNDSLLKPLKINDEITIIPQPAQRQSRNSGGGGGSSSSNNNNNTDIIEIL